MAQMSVEAARWRWMGGHRMSREDCMKFLYRANIQACAGPVHKNAGGFRSTSLHVSSIADAAERFLRDQLTRKREKTLQR